MNSKNAEPGETFLTVRCKNESVQLLSVKCKACIIFSF